MYIQVINTKYKKNNEYIGKIFEVRKEIMDINNDVCFKLKGTTKVFRKVDCEVLNNVISINRSK